MDYKYFKIINFIKRRKILIIFFFLVFWLISYLFLPLNITENNASFEVADGSNLNKVERTGLTISDQYRAIPKTTKITNKILDEH